jgi:tetratricopeptide (TPR) repeat protein
MSQHNDKFEIVSGGSEGLSRYSSSLVRRGLDDLLSSHNEHVSANEHTVDSWMRKGIDLITEHRYVEALNCFESALAIDAGCAPVWGWKGDTLADLNKYAEAIESYERVLELGRSDLVDWWKKANCHRLLSQFEQAASCYEKISELPLIDDEARSDAWNMSGVCLYWLGRYGDALVHFTRAITVNPEYVSGWFNRGLSLAGMKNYRDAIWCYDKAIKLDLTHAGSWYNKALAHRDLGDWEQALTCLEHCGPEIPTIDLSYPTAFVLEKLGRTQEAIKSYEQFLAEAASENNHRIVTFESIEYAKERLSALRSQPK